MTNAFIRWFETNGSTNTAITTQASGPPNQWPSVATMSGFLETRRAIYSPVSAPWKGCGRRGPDGDPGFPLLGELERPKPLGCGNRPGAN
jgi:hypothetical protein